MIDESFEDIVLNAATTALQKGLSAVMPELRKALLAELRSQPIDVLLLNKSPKTRGPKGSVKERCDAVLAAFPSGWVSRKVLEEAVQVPVGYDILTALLAEGKIQKHGDRKTTVYALPGEPPPA